MRVGDYNTRRKSWDTDPHPHQEFSIRERIRHVLFSSRNHAWSNDIGLIWLDGAVEFKWYISIITLAARDAAFFGKTAKVVGWGRTDPESSTLPRELQEIHVNGIHAKCKFIFSRSAPGEGPWSGDSGSPLTVQSGPNNLQIGVMQSRHPWPNSTLPTRYARVSSHFRWIKSELNRRANRS